MTEYIKREDAIDAVLDVYYNTKVGQVIAWMPMPEPLKEEHHE